MANTTDRPSETSSFQVKEGDILCSPFSRYNVLEILGSGVFGQVAKCQNISTMEMVAVKILFDSNTVEEAEQEVDMLRRVASLNHPNMLKFFEKFEYQGYLCLVFEILHKDLWSTVVDHDCEMKLNEIRPIAAQLFSALEALTDVGILHTDVKPDNVMLVGRSDLKVKLIDFGLAFNEAEAITGDIMQPVHYRSPEILLGLPYGHGIDVWGVGCLLAFLYLHEDLFYASTTYGMVRHIVQVLGQPGDHLLCEGKYTGEFFTVVESSEGLETWRLKTPEEYAAAASPEEVEEIRDFKFKSLDDLVGVHKFKSTAEQEDRLQFVDLLKSLFEVDGEERVAAFQARNHPFITMSHLSERHHEAYLRDAEEKMACCHDGDSAESQEEQEDDQQVWAEELDGDDLEEPEPRVWGQSTDDQWEELPEDDWEQSEDGAWEESESVHLDYQEEGQVQVTPKDQAESLLMVETVSGVTVVTCPPDAPPPSTTTTDCGKTLSQQLPKFWRKLKGCFLCGYKI